MTFPVVASRTATSFSSTSGTSHNVNMPATVNAGDLLLMFFASFSGGIGATTLGAAPSGWTKVAETDGSRCQSALFMKVADGTEDSTTVNITTSPGRSAVAHVLRITGWYGALSGVEQAVATSTSNHQPDPPNLTPSWGAKDTLWIASYCVGDDNATFTTAPTNYTNGQGDISGASVNNSAEVGTAYRELNATSEDPGAFTLSETEIGNSYTVAIRPVDVQTLVASSIASAEAFGSHTISGGLQILVASAITSAEAFGSHTILTGGPVLDVPPQHSYQSPLRSNFEDHAFFYGEVNGSQWPIAVHAVATPAGSDTPTSAQVVAHTDANGDPAPYEVVSGIQDADHNWLMDLGFEVGDPAIKALIDSELYNFNFTPRDNLGVNGPVYTIEHRMGSRRLVQLESNFDYPVVTLVEDMDWPTWYGAESPTFHGTDPASCGASGSNGLIFTEDFSFVTVPLHQHDRALYVEAWPNIGDTVRVLVAYLDDNNYIAVNALRQTSSTHIYINDVQGGAEQGGQEIFLPPMQSSRLRIIAMLHRDTTLSGFQSRLHFLFYSDDFLLGYLANLSTDLAGEYGGWMQCGIGILDAAINETLFSKFLVGTCISSVIPESGLIADDIFGLYAGRTDVVLGDLGFIHFQRNPLMDPNPPTDFISKIFPGGRVQITPPVGFNGNHIFEHIRFSPQSGMLHVGEYVVPFIDTTPAAPVFGTLADRHSLVGVSEDPVAIAGVLTTFGSPAPVFSDNGTLPIGKVVDAVTGIIAGNPAAIAGTYAVVITATNSQGSDTLEFVWEVENASTQPPILLEPIPDQLNHVDDVVQINLDLYFAGVQYFIGTNLPDGAAVVGRYIIGTLTTAQFKTSRIMAVNPNGSVFTEFSWAVDFNVLIAVPIFSEEIFGESLIGHPFNPQGIESEETFGTHSIGPLFVAFSIPSEEIFGMAIVIALNSLNAVSVPSAEAFGNHLLKSPGIWEETPPLGDHDWTEEIPQ